jgi:hypothetical protein
MSRALLAFLAALLCAGAALGQVTVAPTLHPGTKLNFAPTLGSAQFQASAVHGNAMSYRYLAGKVELTVQVFDGGRRVPAGSSNPAVIYEFSSEMADAEQQSRASGLTGFEKPAVPAACNYGAGLVFRCTVYSANTGNGRLYGKLLLIGFRDHFVKIIAEWTQVTGATLAEADRALEAFIPALMR